MFGFVLMYAPPAKLYLFTGKRKRDESGLQRHVRRPQQIAKYDSFACQLVRALLLGEGKGEVA